MAETNEAIFLIWGNLPGKSSGYRGRSRERPLPRHTLQTRALHTYLRWRNANAHHRDALSAERKERARIRSEKGIRWGGAPSPPQPEETGEATRSPAH